MYKVTPLDSGKWHNVLPGARYCLTKKYAKELMKNFLEVECEIEVERFIRLTRGIYAWSDANEKVEQLWNEVEE